MKRIILLFCTLVLTSTTSLALPIENKPITVFMDGEAMTFETSPILIGDQVMVPMRPFFEALDTQVNWLQDTQTVVAYKNNMFIKLQIDNKEAYKNGKSFTLKSPPTIRDNRTLVPAQFIAETFDMKSSWLKTNQLNLESRTSIPEYYRFGDYFYKKITLPNQGISLSIPNYWDTLDATNNVYGVKTELDNYYVNLTVQSLNKTESLDQYLDDYRQSLIDLYGDIVKIGAPQTVNYNNLKGYKFKATISLKESTEDHIYYLFFDHLKGYLFNCSYKNKIAATELEEIFDNVVSTFKVDHISVDSKHEHYVEFPLFYDLNFKLNQEIHSNMEVRNELNFEGHLKPQVIDSLFVKVSKGNEHIYFKTKVDDDGTFAIKAYTPFGLGKHDVCIMSQKDTIFSPQNAIMQFSVLNLSNDKIRYLIPSDKINSDNSYIISQANLITYKATSDYNRAKGIFDWIQNEITIEDLSSKTRVRKTEEVYLEKLGTDEEITHLYAAMLRSVGIATRVKSGSIKDILNKHSWVEININGKWILSDPVYALRYQNLDIVNPELYTNYFRLDSDHYNDLFSSIITETY